LILQLFSCINLALAGQILSKTKSSFWSWNNRKFKQRTCMLHEPRYDSVSTFMISYCFFSLRSNKCRFFFNTSNNSLRSQLEIDHRNIFFVASCRNYCCLIAKIFYISTTKTRCQCSQSFSILLRCEFLIKSDWLQMNHKYLFSSFDVR